MYNNTRETKAIEKYIDYLNGLIKKFISYELPIFKNVVVISEENLIGRIYIPSLNRIIEGLLMTKEEYIKNNIVMDNFKLLSKTLLQSPLNNKESLDIILYFIKRNQEMGIFKQDIPCKVIQYDKLLKNGLSNEEINYLKNDGIMDTIIYSDSSELSSKDLKYKKILEKIINDDGNTNDIGEQFDLVEKHLINKSDSYTIDDIDKVISAFSELEVDKDLCARIKYLLTQELEIRNYRAKKATNTKTINDKNHKPDSKNNNSIKKDNEESKYVSDKEYKEIRKQIKEHFNIHTGELYHSLTEDETIHLAYQLLRIGQDEDIVRTLFRRAEILQESLDNPIAKYNQLYSRMNYYSNNPRVYDSMQLLEQYFSEIFISNSEDYMFWKENINQEMNNIQYALPGTYDYEISLAKNYKPKYKSKTRGIK